jgi:hypothetical protein
MSEMLLTLLLNRVNQAFGPINYIVVNRSVKRIKSLPKMAINREWLGAENKKTSSLFRR